MRVLLVVAGLSSSSQSARAQTALRRDRLLVAASAALVSLASNPDTHFRLINEGAAPALVAVLQNGRADAE